MRPFLACLLLATSLLVPGEAAAQLFRTYLASTGNDANPCTVAAPCRLLPKALSVVNDFGEVWMLDSANYNTATVNVTKSVTILAVPGALGSLVSVNGPAVQVNSTVRVTFRNLSFTLLTGTPGAGGIYATAPGVNISIEGARFENLIGTAVKVDGVNAVLNMRDSVLRSVESGVRLRGGARGMVSNVKVHDITSNAPDAAGFLADATVPGTQTQLTVEDSTVSNAPYAFAATDFNIPGGGTARLTVVRCTVARAGSGVFSYTVAQGAVVAMVNGCTITDSVVALEQGGPSGQIVSAGNNALHGNTIDGGGTPLTLK